MPTIFRTGNDELVAFQNAQSFDRFLDYFTTRVREWCEPISHCETFTVGTFYDFVQTKLDASVAYVLLCECEAYDVTTLGGKAALRWLDLLCCLASHAEVRDPPQWLVDLAIDLRTEAERIEPAMARHAAWYKWTDHSG